MIIRMTINNNKHCAFNRTHVYYILAWLFCMLSKKLCIFIQICLTKLSLVDI